MSNTYLKNSNRTFAVLMDEKGTITEANNLFRSTALLSGVSSLDQLFCEKEKGCLIAAIQHCKTNEGSFFITSNSESDCTTLVIEWEIFLNESTGDTTFVAIGIESKCSISDTDHDITRQQYKSLFDHNPDPIFTFDLDGNFTSANAAVYKTSNYNKDELHEQHFLTLIHPEDLELTVRKFEKCIGGKAQHYVSRMIRKDGKTRFLNITNIPIVVNGEVTGVFGIAKDITGEIKAKKGLKQNQQNLLKLKHDLEQVLNYSLDLICTIDKQGRFIQVSAASEKLLSYSPKELINQNIAEHIYPEDLEKTYIAIEDAKAGKTVSNFEHRVIRKDGSVHHVEWSARWDSGREVLYVVGRDVTEIVISNKLLEQSEQRFKALVQNGSDMVAIIDAVGNYTYCSPSVNNILGYDSDDLLNRNVLSLIHPEDQQFFLATLQELHTTTQIKPAPFRFKNAAGDWRWIESIATNMLDKPSIDGIVVNSRDITEKKRQEENLQKTVEELRLMASAVINSKDAVMITNANGLTSPEGPLIMFVNEAFTTLTQYNADELIDQSPSILHGEKTDVNLFNLIKEKINTDHAFEGEMIYHKKDGSQFDVELRIAPVNNTEGKCTHFICILHEITARKEKEQERELLIKQLTKSNYDLTQFSYITSHNFKGPLSNLQSILNLISYESLEEYNLHLVGMFKESTLQLSQTVKDLNEILIIKNNVNIEKDTVNISDIFHNVSTSLNNALVEKKGAINVDFSVEKVRFNKAYMESILLNLLTNSLKYASADRPLKIDVSTQKINGNVNLKFSDNGLGIDMDRNKGRVFGLYQKFHNNADSQGLGLFIIKSQITALGGSIDIESEVDKGTAFTICLKD